jgi:hypothetical protein
MSACDDLSFDYFYLCSVSCTGTQEDLGGSQLPGAIATTTQEGGGTQPSSGEWPEVAYGGAGSSHSVAGSTAAVAMMTPPADDARRRQIHPRDQLTYPRDQTWATARADRQQQKKRCCYVMLCWILFRKQHSYL